MPATRSLGWGYHEANAFLGGKASRTAPIGTSTRIIRRSPTSIAVQYHNTDVVTYHRGDTAGTIELNTGGWRTATTKQRMMEYSGWRMQQEKGEWFVHYGGQKVPFNEGMVVIPGPQFGRINNRSAFPDMHTEAWGAKPTVLPEPVPHMAPPKDFLAMDRAAGQARDAAAMKAEGMVFGGDPRVRQVGRTYDVGSKRWYQTGSRSLGEV